MLLHGKDAKEFGLSRKQKQLLEKVDLESWLRLQSNPVAQNLTERTAAPWTDQDITDFEKDLVVSFGAPPDARPASDKDRGVEVSGPKCVERIAQILSKVIATKNRTEHLSLPRMRIVWTPPHPINPFCQDVVTALARVKIWRWRLGKGIRKLGSGECPSRGIVLLSAALYGGVFDGDLLIAVARALEQAPRTLGFANKQLYVQISAAWRGTQDFSQRTWYPDPLTAILIARLMPGDPRESKLNGTRKEAIESLWSEMIGAFRAAVVETSDEPENRTDFFKDLRVASQVRMPSLLAAYAAHSIRSEGLPAKTLRRIYSVRPAESFPVVAEARQQSEEGNPIGFLDDYPPEVEPDLERALRQVLPLESTEEALKVLRDIEGDKSWPRFVRSSLILEFTAYLLSGEGRAKPMQMGTVRAWVPTLVRQIGVYLQQHGLLARSRRSSDVLEDIYREALDEIDPEDETPSVQECLVDSLRAFHKFLVRKHRVKPLLDTSLFVLDPLGSTVDANLVTLEEYHQILRWLDRNCPSTLDPALLPMARMMVILGFRCGLRRGEALAINWYDVCGGGPKPELLIQPSSGHRLKSSSAKRRLPLFLLMEHNKPDLMEKNEPDVMEKSELGEILDLARTREAASSGSIKEDAMFDGVTARRLLRIIHKAMRAVTKDPTIKFHHLRHSFATWTFMRFMIGESGNVPEQLRHLPETRVWLEDSPDFCRRAHDILPATTRMNAYLLAQMMGHSSPSITFRHYIHGVDWLLDSCLRANSEFQPSPSILAVAGGIVKRTAYNRAEHEAAVTPARMLTRKWPELTVATAAAVEPIPLWRWRSWDLLYRHFRRRDNRPGYEEQYGFTEDQAVGFFQRATYLSDICGSGPDRIACPVAPRINTDIAVVDKFAPKLSSLLSPRSIRSQLIPTLRYYADNIWQDHNQLFFHDPDQPGPAIAYLKLLKGMGIERSQLRFSAFHEMQHCEACDKWKIALDLPDNVAIRPLVPPNRKSQAYGAWIGIEPCFSNSTPAPVNNESGVFGFRFLMLMAHIVYGVTDIEQVCVDLIDELRQARVFPREDCITSDSGGKVGVPKPLKATMLCNPTATIPQAELSEPDTPRRGSRKKEPKPWIKVWELAPIIEELLLPGGPLHGKPYPERKRLLIAYFGAVKNAFPEAWADEKRRKYSLLKISGLGMMIGLLANVMERCDSYEQSTYDLETFTRQLEPVAGLALLGGWERPTVAAGISSKGKRAKLHGKLQEALRVTPLPTATT